MQSIPTKLCPGCHEQVPMASEYWHRHKNRRDGWHIYCKACRHANQAESERRELRARIGDEPSTKPCRECGRILPNDEEHFVRRRAGIDVFNNQCRDCAAMVNAAYREEHHAALCADARARHAANRDENNRGRRERYYAHHAHYLEYDRRRRCTERRRAQWRAMYQRNRVTIDARNRNRRARIRAAPGRHDGADIERLLAAQHGRCWWCRKKTGSSYHVDHRIPIARGGTNDAGNLVISCPHCNTSKGSKLPHEWNGRLM